MDCKECGMKIKQVSDKKLEKLVKERIELIAKLNEIEIFIYRRLSKLGASKAEVDNVTAAFHFQNMSRNDHDEL